uniref:Uncharacterized protein n=9 Tax=Enterobacteriaceae TaxID=543 RepID=A0A7G8AJK2_ECOLX|nr:hypothetical protein [Escherichia coli]QNI19793.1 hypothetical protein HPHBBJMH_00158 [Escherichia coli]
MTFRGNLLLYSLWYELHPFENLRRKGHHCHGLTHLSWAERKIFYRVLGKKFCGLFISPLDSRRRLWLYQPPATGTHTGVWHPAGNEGPRRNDGERVRETALPYIPAAFCRDAGSAGHGATEAARPERSLQAQGFASGIEARQGGDSSAGSVHDSPPRQGDARKSHKQERNGKKRKRKKKKNNNKHGNHRKITSEKNIPDTSQTGRVTGDASAWPASLPAGVSLPGVFARADRRPPPPALYHLFLLP